MRNRALSSLLLFIPIGLATHILGCPDWAIFSTNFMAVLPMAWLIGKATEDMAASTGETLGGLLNATFGNVVEMLLCINGIRQEQIILIQCTLIGSILSNMLLVMGTAFLVGGARFHIQRFSQVSSSIQSSLMLLSVLGVVLPTMYSMLIPEGEAIERISHGCAVLLFAMYIQFLVFELWTHSDDLLLEDKADQSGEKEAEEEDEEVDLSPKAAALVLGACTVLTAWCTDYLISSMEGTLTAWRVSREFIGIVVLPIIGNAAEHWTAILSAYHNKMDLALAVAVGSSCQMALLVTPFTVLVGWVYDKPITLDFHPFQAMVLLLAVLIVSNILKDGESTWFLGSMLCAAYLVIGLIYFKGDVPDGDNIVEYVG